MDKSVTKVVVLGDIGRSPRMQYHALSLANNGSKVDLIGYIDSTPLVEILEHPKISITKLRPLSLTNGPKFLLYIIKAVWQAIDLLLALIISGNCNYLLCQNPPAIPSLVICRFYCLLSRSIFIIDWHNYAFSIMALNLPPKSYLLNISEIIERYFGQSSDHNLCVTYAMKEDLIQNWNIKATVLYDRAPKIFHSLSLQEKHNWFLKFNELYPEFGSFGREQLNQLDGTKTALTELVDNKVQLRPDRPALLFSSTSWTPDEDFSILMEALQAYETSYITKSIPKLICVITGKGPMKQKYIEEIRTRNWQNVKVLTPWLEACDYPKMVASADLGVCLHTSSSGLDLPMKVVDMFGAGLPVCAYYFKCLYELVEENVNGFTFRNSDELSKLLVSWFEGFPNNPTQNKKIDKMKTYLKDFQTTGWEENWDLRAKQFFP